jgi:hypothetical protein
LGGSPPHNKAAAGIFRGGNFFVRANDVSGFFGEFGCNQLDGFHFHFSRVLPLASFRFFRIWIRILLHGSDGFALGFSGHRLTSFQWMIGFKRAFQDLMGFRFFKGLDILVLHGSWMLGRWFFGLGFLGFHWMSDIWLFGY